ncbi:MAG: hypothetical protein M0027_14510 [Candidatus Dormibacteraeota bacterium]|nr:hypothetical protein [Candidatus Dormibacteraeota bacterium]
MCAGSLRGRDGQDDLHEGLEAHAGAARRGSYGRRVSFEEAVLPEQLGKLSKKRPQRGSRRVAAVLQRHGWMVDRKFAQRLGREESCGCLIDLSAASAGTGRCAGQLVRADHPKHV